MKSAKRYWRVVIKLNKPVGPRVLKTHDPVIYKCMIRKM